MRQKLHRVNVIIFHAKYSNVVNLSCTTLYNFGDKKNEHFLEGNYQIVDVTLYLQTMK